jgi:VWFA-related protein
VFRVVGLVLLMASMWMGNVRPVTFAQDSTSVPLFRVTAKLVQVDVVARDKAGRPIRDLKQSDFVLLQDGKPQEVRSFELQSSESNRREKTLAPPEAELLRNSFNNVPADVPVETSTIVLYDILNTPLTAQQSAKQELIKFLKSVPPGTPVALYVLNTRPRMAQGFTTNQKALLETAESLKPERSSALTTEAERQRLIGQAIYIQEMKGRSPTRSADATERTEAFRIGERTYLTLSALNTIARAVAGYPGRKNLMWLSGSFPMDIEPGQYSQADAQRNDPRRYVRDFLRSVDATGALLANARIAVYPIDVRGIQTSGSDVTVGAGEIVAYRGSDQASLLHQQFVNRGADRSTMNELARETGGRAFVGLNDFAESMKQAVEEGSTYYTLAYVPEKSDDEAAYHRLEVKVNRPDVSLSYRQGYYYMPPKTSATASAASLQAALQPGLPASTMLFFGASGRYEADKKELQIEYRVLPYNITFSEMPKGAKRVLVDVMAIAFDESGKEVSHASDTVDGTIPAASYDQAMKGTLPARQQLALKPGRYNLHLGVMDRSSQRLGTVHVPLEIK